MRLVAIVLDSDTFVLTLLVNNSNLFIISLLNINVGGIQPSKPTKEMIMIIPHYHDEVTLYYDYRGFSTKIVTLFIIHLMD